MNCQLVVGAFQAKRWGISVVGATDNADEALASLKIHEPDVALISARLPAGPEGGFSLLRSIRALKLRTREIILLDSRSPDLVVDAFRFGARGVFFRNEPVDVLIKCIHAVQGGQIWANSENLGHVIEALSRAMPFVSKTAGSLALLTKREEDIVKLVTEGMTNRQISSELRLSEHTVRNYLFRIFDKLGVSTRVELVLYFLQRVQQNSDSAPEIADSQAPQTRTLRFRS